MTNQSFHPGEYGKDFPCDYDDRLAVETAINHVIMDAHRELMPLIATHPVFEIRGKIRPSTREAAAEWGVAWYSLPAITPSGHWCGPMEQTPLFRVPHTEAKLNKLGGYLLIARIAVRP